MPLTIRVDCPHCHHAQIRVGPPSHTLHTYPSGVFVDPAIECPSCAGPFAVRASRAEPRSRVHPPPGTRLPDAPAHATPPPKLKATPVAPTKSPSAGKKRSRQAKRSGGGGGKAEKTEPPVKAQGIQEHEEST